MVGHVCFGRDWKECCFIYGSLNMKTCCCKVGVTQRLMVARLSLTYCCRNKGGTTVRFSLAIVFNQNLKMNISIKFVSIGMGGDKLYPVVTFQKYDSE